MVDRIPILKMGKYLLLTIQVDMHDQLALDLQEDLTEQIVRHKAKGVLIDISWRSSTPSSAACSPTSPTSPASSTPRS